MYTEYTDSELLRRRAVAMELSRLRERIVLDLAAAVRGSVSLLRESMQGSPKYENDAQLRAILEMVKLSPLLLEQCADLHRILDNDSNIPVCPHCGQGPDEHWPDQCPTVADNNAIVLNSSK